MKYDFVESVFNIEFKYQNEQFVCYFALLNTMDRSNLSSELWNSSLLKRLECNFIISQLYLQADAN